jgi:uncharacterized protein YqcC (DUF446 family)
MKRTQSHSKYFSPSRDETRARFQELGFKLPYSYDLVVDLANAFSFVMEGENPANSIKELSLEDLSGNYKSEEEMNKALNYHQNVQRFVSSLNYEAFTGRTPLEKAANVIAMLSSQEGGQSPDESSEGDETPLPIFMEGKVNPEQIAQKLEEEVDNIPPIDAFSESAMDKFLNVSGATREVRRANIPRHKLGLLNKIALLGDRGKIKAARTSAKANPTQMTEYAQVSRLNSLTSAGMPNFNYKLATKQLVVKNSQQSTKQMLICLVDESSSMDSIQKQEWLTALFLNRIDAVLKNKAELVIIPFGTEIYDQSQWIVIRNKKQGIDAIEMLKKKTNFFNYGGGSTNVSMAIQQTEQAVKDGKMGANLSYQIVIMNDGNDSIGDYKPKIVTNAFILGQDNKDLKAMVEATGGLYERFL